MKRLLISAALVGAVLVLTACGGGGSDTDSSPDAAPSAGTTVSVAQVGGVGRVLVDSAGQALYSADEEADRRVLCTESCLSFWTPLTLDEGEPTAPSVPGTLGLVERPDGSRQVTHNGKRLYSFVEDEPGESRATVSQTRSTASDSPGMSSGWAATPTRAGHAPPTPRSTTSPRGMSTRSPALQGFSLLPR
jgi:predicted lipoprotein with Yx(FWY)xxD motif